MLPSPASSPQPVLYDRTNVLNTPIQTKLSFSLPTPPQDGVQRIRPAATASQPRLNKRKLSFDDHSDAPSDSEKSDPDRDVEMEDIAVVRARARRYNPFHTRTRAATELLGRGRRGESCTRSILQSFVSSHKSDIFKCQSNDMNAYLTPPYACSYTQSAKKGGLPLLAVATEQGTVHLLDTSKRMDWDPEPPRTTLQIHNNGIFDVKWNTDDTLLATCSGDKSMHITCATTQTVTHALRGHASTVKCVAWDHTHRELLSSGGRNGSICIWDLRVASARDTDEAGPSVLSPVISISGGHQDVKVGRRRKNLPAPRSVTSLVYPEIEPYGLISSGSFDGILKYWDLRLPTSTRKSKPTTTKPPASLYSSPVDPTTLHGSRRPRGIVRLSAGAGPTAGLVFGLGADCRIHTYSLPSLQALQTEYGHEKMQNNSFYVGLSLSPCGRWLAAGSGGSGTVKHGSAFLFDVGNASRPWLPIQNGVQLHGQQGEVGAIDWGEGMLATCADDGTVRMWRPDIETYRRCVEQPEESKWDWSWAT